MVNAYTTDNAAKRLNCSRNTILRAIYDGRFHDCFKETGLRGHPAWMIPSDQVESWVTNGGFLQPKTGSDRFMSRNQVKAALEKAREEVGTGTVLADELYAAFKKNTDGILPEGSVVTKRDENGKAVAGRYPIVHPNEIEPPRTIFDPEVGKEVPVLNLLGDRNVDAYAEDILDNKRMIEAVQDRMNEHFAQMPEDVGKFANQMTADDEFAKRAVKRVAKPKWTKVYERIEKQKEERDMKESTAVLTDNGDISVTIPKDIISDILASRMKASIEVRISSLRKAINMMNEELKALEEAIA